MLFYIFLLFQFKYQLFFYVHFYNFLYFYISLIYFTQKTLLLLLLFFYCFFFTIFTFMFSPNILFYFHSISIIKNIF